jgi:hypothetical protein
MVSDGRVLRPWANDSEKNIRMSDYPINSQGRRQTAMALECGCRARRHAAPLYRHHGQSRRGRHGRAWVLPRVGLSPGRRAVQNRPAARHRAAVSALEKIREAHHLVAGRHRFKDGQLRDLSALASRGGTQGHLAANSKSTIVVATHDPAGPRVDEVHLPACWAAHGLIGLGGVLGPIVRSRGHSSRGEPPRPSGPP